PLEGAVGHLRLADLDGELDLGGTADRGDRGAVALVREADCTTDEPRLETAARNHVVQPNVAERPGLLGLLGADHLDLEVAKVLARLRQDLHHVPRGARPRAREDELRRRESGRGHAFRVWGVQRDRASGVRANRLEAML